MAVVGGRLPETKSAVYPATRFLPDYCIVVRGFLVYTRRRWWKAEVGEGTGLEGGYMPVRDSNMLLYSAQTRCRIYDADSSTLRSRTRTASHTTVNTCEWQHLSTANCKPKEDRLSDLLGKYSMAYHPSPGVSRRFIPSVMLCPAQRQDKSIKTPFANKGGNKGDGSSGPWVRQTKQRGRGLPTGCHRSGEFYSGVSV